MNRIPGFLDPWGSPLHSEQVVGTVEGRVMGVFPAMKEIADVRNRIAEFMNKKRLRMSGEYMCYRICKLLIHIKSHAWKCKNG
jgi:hypothetical protein